MAEFPTKIPDRAQATYHQPELREGPGWTPLTTKRDEVRQKFQHAVAKSRQQYHFKPLAEGDARILLVQPRTGSRHLHVELRTVKIKDLGTKRVPYEALSYCWGSEDADQPVFVKENAQLESLEPFEDAYQVAYAVSGKYFLVRPNLHAALHHLRTVNQPVALWVDALCMDQENPTERQQQVSRMADIYAAANRVLIWLGDGNQRTKSAIEFVRTIVCTKKKSDIYHPSYAQSWSDLLYLMQSSWFSRRWVIQELALAKEATVHCGEDEINWVDLRSAINLFIKNFDKIRSLLKYNGFPTDAKALSEPDVLAPKLLVTTVNNILRWQPGKGGSKSFEPTQTLEYLVSHLSAFSTADGRDTIYAFRNICKEKRSPRQEDERVLTPDYGKDLLQVYAGFVEWVVNKTNSLDIICRHWAIPERLARGSNYKPLVKLPSWIRTMSNASFTRQDRSNRTRVNADSLVGFPNQSGLYNACLGTKAEVRFEIDPPQSEGEAAAAAKLRVEARLQHSQDAAANASMPEQSSAAPERVKSVGINTSQHDSRNARNEEHKSNPLKRKAEGDHNGRDSQAKRVETSAQARGKAPHPGANPSLQVYKRRAFLWAAGLQIGTVVKATDPIADGVIPYMALKQLRGKLDLTNDNDLQLVNDKLWRILCAERGDHGRPPDPDFERACRFCLVSETPNKHLNVKELLDRDDLDDHVVDFLKRARAVIWNRRFLQVDRGNHVPATQGVSAVPAEPLGSESSQDSQPASPTFSLGILDGLGPSEAEVNDIVCILFGCSVPVILRPHKRRAGVGAYYTLVGEAYIYGYMEGEALSLREDSNPVEKDKKWFRIG